MEDQVWWSRVACFCQFKRHKLFPRHIPHNFARFLIQLVWSLTLPKSDKSEQPLSEKNLVWTVSVREIASMPMVRFQDKPEAAWLVYWSLKQIFGEARRNGLHNNQTRQILRALWIFQYSQSVGLLLLGRVSSRNHNRQTWKRRKERKEKVNLKYWQITLKIISMKCSFP